MSRENTIIVCDYGSGTPDRVHMYWSNKIDHITVRGTVHSRRSIVGHILGERLQPASMESQVFAYDPFCIRERHTLSHEGLLITCSPDSPPSSDILMVCNPPYGVHQPSSGMNMFGRDYSGYIPGIFSIAENMQAGSQIFVQLDRAYVEDFPDTEACRDDNRIFWQILLGRLQELGFIISVDNFLLGLSLDRYGPLESKLLTKVK